MSCVHRALHTGATLAGCHTGATLAQSRLNQLQIWQKLNKFGICLKLKPLQYFFFYLRVILFCRTKVPDLSIFAPICSEARGRPVCRARLVMLVSGGVSSSCRITSTWGTCPSRWVVAERGRGPGRNRSPGWSCLSVELGKT